MKFIGLRSKGQPRAAKRFSEPDGRKLPVWGWCLLGLVAVTFFLVVCFLGMALYSWHPVLALALAIVQAGSIPLSWLSPRRGLVLSLFSLAMQAAIISPGNELPQPVPVPTMLAQLTLMAVVTFRSTWVLAVVAWLATAVVAYLAGVWFGFRPLTIGGMANLLVLASVGSAVVVMAFLLRQWQVARSQLTAQRRLSAEEAMRRTVAEEKAAIARELHDVVAHGMSIVAVQATSAPYRHSDVSAPVAAEFEQIAEHSRKALREMRQLLGVLRAPGSAREDVPQPGVEQIPELIEAVQRTGTPVVFTATSAEQFNPVAQLVAYRVVQEALSNVVRHAPGAHTTVSVVAETGTEPRRLRILIRNEAPPEPDALADTTRTSANEAGSVVTSSVGGHGIVGMRERVQAVAGSFQCGPTREGGYQVEADIPELAASGVAENQIAE